MSGNSLKRNSNVEIKENVVTGRAKGYTKRTKHNVTQPNVRLESYVIIGLNKKWFKFRYGAYY